MWGDHMKKILVTGALGQIGSELTMYLRKLYGFDSVIASGLHKKDNAVVIESGPFELIDVQNAKQLYDCVKKYNVDTIIHLAAILSAVGEDNPSLAWKINVDGLFNTLEVARENNCAVFTPSSIAAFGPTTPSDQTPQLTIQRPTTMYGVTKVSGEILCDYYYQRYGVDTRGVRYPGIISYVTLPGGGTTDYAVHIYYDALLKGKFTCNLSKGTFMDMMYMPDALDAVVQLMEANPENLINRNAFNITAMQFDPELIYLEIKKHIPDFTIDYNIDRVKQKIADSWPNSLDDSAAQEEWGWKPKYNLESMTIDMLDKLKEKLAK